MKLSNMHIHSKYSWDCKMEIEQAVKNLIESHVYYAGICDHIEFDFEKVEDIIEKFKVRNLEIDELNEKYFGQIKLLKGAEISSPHLYPAQVEKISELNFDYLMGSIHKIDRKAKTVEEKKLGTYNYYKEILKMVSANQIDIIGHLDYINRYYKTDYSDELMIEEIFSVIKDNKQIIEINTSSFRRGYFYSLSFPSAEKLIMYRKYKEEITIGTDSHKLDELNYMLDENEYVAKRLSLKPVVFEKRKMIKL